MDAGLKNKVLIRRQIEALPPESIVRESLQILYEEHYGEELDEIGIEFQGDKPMLAIGYDVRYPPEEVPLIWAALKASGEVRKAFSAHLRKRILHLRRMSEEIEQCSKEISRLRTQLEALEQ